METLLIVSLGLNVGLIVVIGYLFKQSKQAVKKAEKNIFDLFMAGAYTDRLTWFKTLNQVPTQKSTIFIGDSLIQEWPIQELFENATYLNRGIGGDTSHQLFKRLDVTFHNLEPTQIVILIGTNDFLEPTFEPDQTINNIKAIIKILKTRYPKSTIHLLSLLPVGNPLAHENNKETIAPRDNQTINTINQVLQTQSDVVYHDLNALLKDDQGFLKLTYTREGLHLSPQGYLKITETLKSEGL